MADDTKPADGTPNPSPESKPSDDGQKPTEGGNPAPKADDKPKGEQPPNDGAKADEGGDPAPKAEPIKYELAIPEGDLVTAEELAEIAEVAAANGWTNEEAQAQLEAVHARRESQAAAFLEELKADPTYGGDNLATTDKRMKAVLDRHAPEGTDRGDTIRGVLKRSGYGNHVAFVGFLADIGKSYVEDTVPGGSPSGGRGPQGPLTTDVIAERLYGKTSKR